MENKMTLRLDGTERCAKCLHCNADVDFSDGWCTHHVDKPDAETILTCPYFLQDTWGDNSLVDEDSGRGTCSNCAFYDEDIGDCGAGMEDPENPEINSCYHWERSSYR